MLRTAVVLAGDAGIDSVSMGKVSQELGVAPMALYKHVANKDERLDGIVDASARSIRADWMTSVRQRILSARRALLGHPWASRVIESRTTPTPIVLEHGFGDCRVPRRHFSIDLSHRVMHALGVRMFGSLRSCSTTP